MLHRPDRGTNWPGHSVVEFGLVSLLFLAMFMSTADLGRAVFQRQELSHAVREGARFAMVAEDARKGTALVSQIASAASQRSPSLGLSATNFQSSAGGEVTCQEWPGASRSVPQQFADMPIMLGNGLIALGASAAKKPTPTPTRTPTGSQQPTATPTRVCSQTLIRVSREMPLVYPPTPARYDSGWLEGRSLPSTSHGKPVD